MKKKVWHRVKAPTVWRPKVGEELIGTFLGSEVREGEYGPYKIHMVKVNNGIKYVSGAVLNDLFGLLDEGSKVKVVYTGTKKVSDTDRVYKTFEVYSEEAVEFRVAETA